MPHPADIQIVSTDGSCLRNPGGAIGWAWVNHHGGFDSGGAASGTNQIAELTAVLRAIHAHPGATPLLIESDSRYAIQCATDWLPGWKRKGWRTSTGKPVQNLHLVQGIDEAIAERPGPVRFRWVRGHVGHTYNERADELARLAAGEWAAGRGAEVSDVFEQVVADVAPARPPAVRARTARASNGKGAWQVQPLFD